MNQKLTFLQTIGGIAAFVLPAATFGWLLNQLTKNEDKGRDKGV